LFWKIKLYFWSSSSERINYFSNIVKRAKNSGKKIWITELQAEPWEPGELVHEGKQNPKTIHPDVIAITFNEIYSLGVETILLWGAEYWYFRKIKYSDLTWWQKAIRLINRSKSKNNEIIK